MLAPGSQELAIEKLLRELEMSTRNCAAILEVFRLKLSKTGLTDALAGKTKLNPSVAQQIVELLHELKEVRTMFKFPSPTPIPFDWSRHEQIADFVLLARFKRAEAEIQSTETIDAGTF